MTLDQRVTRAVHRVADGVIAPEVDLDEVRSRARANRRRTVSVVATAVVVGIIAVSATVVADRDSSAPIPPSTVPPSSMVPPSSTVPPSSMVSPSTITAEPIVTGPKSWTDYRSSQYGFAIGHPPRWTEVPASRAWSWESDVRQPMSPGHDVFQSPAGDVRVSAWTAPLDPGTREESIDYLVGWVEDYCEESGNSPCTGIADRAVELCLEKWDCHPGLLVPFKQDVQAFFSGGIYASDAMTVVAVWRPESAPPTASYGGSQRLLEDFLSTMQVWPSTTPRSERR
jgi:hypothetical protein